MFCCNLCVAYVNDYLFIVQAGVACEARVSVWHDGATPVFLGEVRLQLRQTALAPLRAWYVLYGFVM